jgi:hypothetical protein
MIESLTAAAIASIIFSEAFKEGGKALGQGVAHTFAQLVNTIRSKFQAHSLEGILTQAENQPTETNRAIFQTVLQSQIDGDSAFANQLQQLVEQLQAQDQGVRQVILSGIEASGDVTAKDITQKATRDGSVDQEMLTQVKANNINVGNLNQEA